MNNEKSKSRDIVWWRVGGLYRDSGKQAMFVVGRKETRSESQVLGKYRFRPKTAEDKIAHLQGDDINASSAWLTSPGEKALRKKGVCPGRRVSPLLWTPANALSNLIEAALPKMAEVYNWLFARHGME